MTFICLFSARLLALVCVGVDYPATPPCIAVMTEVKGQKEQRGIQTKVSSEWLSHQLQYICTLCYIDFNAVH